MQQGGVEEGVEFWVEGWVVEVLLLDEVEEAREREERDRPALVVAVCEEVHEEFGLDEPGRDDVRHDPEQGFALGEGEVVAEDGQPGGLDAELVGVDGEEGGSALLADFLDVAVVVLELVVDWWRGAEL